MAAPDNEFIQRAQKGDMAAFEQLVQKYDEKVLSIAASYTNDPDDAKDIFQEVFLRVYKGLPKFQFRSEFSTWLHRIVTNVCLSFTSKRKNRVLVQIDDEYEGDDGKAKEAPRVLAGDLETDRQAMNSEIAIHVRDALNNLSPQQKMVFTLRHY